MLDTLTIKLVKDLTKDWKGQGEITFKFDTYTDTMDTIHRAEDDIVLGSGQPQVTIKLSKHSDFAKIFRNPLFEICEYYMHGKLLIEEGDLKTFLILCRKMEAAIDNPIVKKFMPAVQRLCKPFYEWNNQRKAKQNISSHYDLGIELYKSFLDKPTEHHAGMQYSCGYFSNDKATLEQAQVAKLKRIAKKLKLKPGMTVLDIGCGFGSLSCFLAETYDVKVVGVTISENQIFYAQNLAKSKGLEDKVDFRLQDYRDLPAGQTFDRIVSVGMLEHVGKRKYKRYFNHINERLNNGGIAVIHTIGSPKGTITNNPWVNKYIFPGGVVPSLTDLSLPIENAGLRIIDFETWEGEHYAQTLAKWCERFLANFEQLKKTNHSYDLTFKRMWEIYLTGFEATFLTHDLDIMHLVLVKNKDDMRVRRYRQRVYRA